MYKLKSLLLLVLPHIRKWKCNRTTISRSANSSSSSFRLAITVIKSIIFVTYVACWVCLCCHNPPNSDMDYRIFFVHTDYVNVWIAHRGVRTLKESARKVDSGKKIPCCTGELNLPQRRAVQCSNQLSYIPFPNQLLN